MKMEKDKLELDKKNTETVIGGQNQDEDNDSYFEQMGLSARTCPKCGTINYILNNTLKSSFDRCKNCNEIIL